MDVDKFCITKILGIETVNLAINYLVVIWAKTECQICKSIIVNIIEIFAYI